MKNAMGNVWRNGLGILAGAGIATLCATARAADLPAFRGPPTRITAESYELHLFALYAALAIGAVMFGAMLYSLFVHRKTAARAARPFHRSVAVEILWALIPWAVIVATAWPAMEVLSEVENPARASITIRASGLQWKWGYEYLKGEGEGISFDSNVYAPQRQVAEGPEPGGGTGRLDVDNPVMVPVGRRVRVVLEARDAIHSWHVPSLGVKQYAIPGLVRETWFNAARTGIYRGLCSIEACGAGRACVLIVVKVVSEADYRRWVDARRRGAASGVAGEIRTQGERDHSAGKALAET